jgi:hypothetical protein
MGGKRLKGVGAARQRVFEVLRTGDADHLTHADLKPMMRVILDTHPGLEFLKEVRSSVTRRLPMSASPTPLRLRAFLRHNRRPSSKSGTQRRWCTASFTP